MSELHDRLERLAARGTRRGADDVLQDAMREARDRPAAESGIDGPDLEILDGEAPFVVAEPEVHRRGRYGTLVAAFGSAALLGVGVLAVTSMFGSGGAGSPESAVRQLADAVSHKDPLAAVDVLVPSEVRSMRETVKHVTKRAADLKIVDDASAPLGGVDFSVDNLQLSTENLADGYAKVSVVSGQLSTSTHRAAMSKLLQDAIDNSDTTDFKGKVDLARLAADSDLPTFVITVRHGGGWYVSPAYTALEYAREAAGGPAAAFGSANAAALGADSPEAAVSDALHALQAGNWDRLMALSPPDELPVYDYRKWIDQEATDTHPDFTIDKLSTTATVSGDTAVVKLDASGTTGSGSDVGKWQVGGTCPAYGMFGDSFSAASGATTGDRAFTSTDTSSSSSSTRLCLAGDLGGVVPFGLFLQGPDLATPSTGPVSVEVVREGGKWFVSPVSTALDILDSTIQHIDERTLYPLIGLGYKLPPDGTITLNQPFEVTGSQFNHVYSFDATKGQQVIGELEGSHSDSFASGQLYTASGREVGYVEFVPKNAGWGASASDGLPESGSYRLLVTGRLAIGTTLTLFDADHAPKALTNPDPTQGFSQSCSSSTGGGVTTCSSSTPTTVYPSKANPAPVVTPFPALPPGCQRTATSITSCAGSASIGKVTASTAP